MRETLATLTSKGHLYSASGTEANLCPSHLTASLTEPFTLPDTWQCGRDVEDLHESTKQRQCNSSARPSFVRPTGKLEEVKGHSLFHSYHTQKNITLECFCTSEHWSENCTNGEDWTGQGETDPSTALEGFTWNFSPQLHADEEGRL